MMLLPFGRYRGKSVAEVAVAAADGHLQSQLEDARAWVSARLSSQTPRERIVWWTFNPTFEAILGSGHSQVAEPLRAQVNGLELPSKIPAVADFCKALGSLF